MQSKIDVICADWQRDEVRIKHIRQTVFVIEQHVDPDLEWDGEDGDCYHALAALNGEWVATGRLTPAGKIGRMAVLKSARGHGCGAAILTKLIEIARDKNIRNIHLHAQTHALSFYRKHGFVTYGEQFDEAGIPHRMMRRSLD